MNEVCPTISKATLLSLWEVYGHVMGDGHTEARTIWNRYFSAQAVVRGTFYSFPVFIRCGMNHLKTGGLGSSHTAPCGTAVPARPPTRSSETTHLDCTPQWVPRATRRGTTVVVQSAPFSLFSEVQNFSKAFNYCKLRTRRPANSPPATMNSTTPVPPQSSAFGAPTSTASLSQAGQLFAGFRSPNRLQPLYNVYYSSLCR